jgi:hypothetical protein
VERSFDALDQVGVAAVGWVDFDPQHPRRRVPEHGCCRECGGEAQWGAAGPGDDCDELALGRAIGAFLDLRRDLQRNAAARASSVHTMDEHFAELFERYANLVPGPVTMRSFGNSGVEDAELVPGLVLARSSHLRRL